MGKCLIRNSRGEPKTKFKSGAKINFEKTYIQSIRKGKKKRTIKEATASLDSISLHHL